MICDGKTHNLINIYTFCESLYEEAVVRWCKNCGAVVIDLDYDNRTSPGYYSDMVFPTMTYPNQRKL